MNDERQLALFGDPSPERKRERVPEPPPGPGWYERLSRRGRMTLWLALLLWAALGLLLVTDWTPLGGDAARPGRPASAPSELALVAVRTAAGPPGLLLMHRLDGEATAVLVPSATVVEVPGVGRRSLAAALRDHGPEYLATALANVLGISVPPVLQGDETALGGLVDALGGVTVDVPETIEIEQGGVLRTPYVAGPARMGGAAFVGFFTLHVPGEQELERLARQNAAWQALFARLAESGSVPAGSFARWAGIDPAAASELFVEAAADDDPSFLTLPVRRVGVTGEDLYQVDAPALRPLHEALADVRTVEERDGRRVRLLVGAEGAIGPAVAGRLVEAGFVIVLTEKASEPHDVTRAVMAENTEQLRGAAQELLRLVGVGRLGVLQRPQTVFDVTLVIGRDWAEANGFPQPAPSPTPRTRSRR